MNRAIRRHHTNRLKKKRKCYWGDFGECKRELTPRQKGQKLTAPKSQSNCMCCMNPRILEGESIQERKNTMSYIEMIKEFYTGHVYDEQSAKDIIHPQFDKTSDENRELMIYCIRKYSDRFRKCPEIIADYGCGIGRLMTSYVQTGISIDGFDVSPSMLKIAKQRLPNSDFFEVNPDGSFVYSSDVRQYDLIYSFLVLQHNCNREMRLKNLKTIHGLLNDSGMCIIQLLFSDFDLVSPHHDYTDNAEGTDTNSKEDNWVRKTTLGDLYEDFSMFHDIEFSFIEFPKGIVQLDTRQVIVIATKKPQLFNKIYKSTYY